LTFYNTTVDDSLLLGGPRVATLLTAEPGRLCPPLSHTPFFIPPVMRAFSSVFVSLSLDVLATLFFHLALRPTPFNVGCSRYSRLPFGFFWTKSDKRLPTPTFFLLFSCCGHSSSGARFFFWMLSWVGLQILDWNFFSSMPYVFPFNPPEVAVWPPPLGSPPNTLEVSSFFFCCVDFF